MVSPKYSEPTLESDDREKVILDKPLEYAKSNEHVDANPDIIRNILLDVQPIKILGQSRELEASKDFYDDFGNERYTRLLNIFIFHFVSYSELHNINYSRLRRWLLEHLFAED